MYRCRVVWDKLRVIVVPSMLWLADCSEHRPLTLRSARVTPCQISLGDPGRLGRRYARRQLF